MTTQAYASIHLPLRISLGMIFMLLLFATSVAAQQPTISVQDAVVAEGNAGTTPATFVVSL